MEPVRGGEGDGMEVRRQSGGSIDRIADGEGRADIGKTSGVLPQVYGDGGAGSGSRMKTSQPVDIMLNGIVPVGLKTHRVIAVKAHIIGQFPVIGYAVAIRTGFFLAALNRPVSVITQSGLRLAGI